MTFFISLLSANIRFYFPKIPKLLENDKDKYIELLSWKFDSLGNIKNVEGNQSFTAADFAESFYIEF